MASQLKWRFVERLSCLESALFSLMIGLGETYFAALVLALGFGEFTASSIAILPVVLGSFLQLGWPYLLSVFRSEKNWIIFCATVQAALLALLGISCLVGRPGISLLFVVTTIYWTAHFSAGPAWNTWITSIVDKSRHFQFFMNRSRVHELAVLAGLLVAGIALQIDSSLQMFGFIFLGAGLFRLGSAVSFCFHPVQKNAVARVGQSLQQTIAQCTEKRQVAQLLAFAFFFQLAVQIAAPFFTPYMLVELKFSYLEFATLISLPFIARTITYKFAADLGAKLGIDRVWTLGVLLVAPLPVLWLFFHEFWQLVLLQILGGIAWSSAEYGQTIALIQRFQPERRSAVLTVSNLVASIGMGIGFIIGGFLWYSTIPGDAYELILAISSTARFLVCLGIPFVIFRKAKVQRIFLRWIGIRPGMGGMARPILTEDIEKQDSNS